jgi:hypothetical protein
MSSSERLLGIVKDLVLPVDIRTRYDIYLTDRRVAIACMGRADRFESDTSEQLSFMPSVFGVPPPVSSYVEKTENRQSIDEKIKDWPLDDILKLSKKSCFYTHDEVEKVKLVLGHSPKFIILSKDCESKFSPDEEQLKQLIEILSTIESLRKKLWIAGKWNMLLDMGFIAPCKFCGSRNLPDAVYCQSCGKKFSE